MCQPDDATPISRGQIPAAIDNAGIGSLWIVFITFVFDAERLKHHSTGDSDRKKCPPLFSG
jgi:hypothetical protein